jgi:outer membrane protein assembly factor BamA
MIAALLLAAAASATPDPAAAGNPFRAFVSTIDVVLSGLGSTATASILRLMNTAEGAPLDALTLQHDLCRLRATGVLYDVTADEESGDDGTALTIRARDRWSLMPKFGLRHGGGRTTANVGVVERNLLGRLIQLTAELQSSSDIPFSEPARYGSLITALAPRIGGSPLTASLSWQREFLDFSGWDFTGAHALVYNRTRHALRGEARWELTDIASAALLAGVVHDGYGLDGSSPQPVTVPENGRTATLGAELTLGVLDDRVATLSGTELRLRLEGAREGLLSDISFGTASATLRTYWVPRAGDTLGVLASAQITSARTDSNLFRAGGLGEIRGFPDSYFLGQRLLRLNLEYRAELLRTDIVLPAITQLAAFVDGGHVSGRADAVAGFNYEGPILSMGGGLRFILIPFARAVARVDVAVGMYPRHTIDVSIGGQQFF